MGAFQYVYLEYRCCAYCVYKSLYILESCSCLRFSVEWSNNALSERHGTQDSLLNIYYGREKMLFLICVL
uniref:Uncharacterized protein n=1 Tax=Rhizophora mucronata TaxID=61149 RepID=A0A2P2LN96_RHIMU